MSHKSYHIKSFNILFTPDDIIVGECMESLPPAYLRLQIIASSNNRNISKIKIIYRDPKNTPVKFCEDFIDDITTRSVCSEYCRDSLSGKIGDYISNLNDEDLSIIEHEYSKYSATPLEGFIGGISAYIAFIIFNDNSVFTDQMMFQISLPYSLASGQCITKNMFQYLSLPLSALSRVSSRILYQLVTFIQTFINIWEPCIITGKPISNTNEAKICSEVIGGLSNNISAKLANIHSGDRTSDMERYLRQSIDEAMIKFKADVLSYIDDKFASMCSNFSSRQPVPQVSSQSNFSSRQPVPLELSQSNFSSRQPVPLELSQSNFSSRQPVPLELSQSNFSSRQPVPSELSISNLSHVSPELSSIPQVSSRVPLESSRVPLELSRLPQKSSQSNYPVKQCDFVNTTPMKNSNIHQQPVYESATVVSSESSNKHDRIPLRSNIPIELSSDKSGRQPLPSNKSSVKPVALQHTQPHRSAIPLELSRTYASKAPPVDNFPVELSRSYASKPDSIPDIINLQPVSSRRIPLNSGIIHRSERKNKVSHSKSDGSAMFINYDIVLPRDPNKPPKPRTPSPEPRRRDNSSMLFSAPEDYVDTPIINVNRSRKRGMVSESNPTELSF